MQVKLVAAVVAASEGGLVNVSEVCRAGGVSRKTFYKWAARYREEGLAGLEERSRRPRRSPSQVRVEVEERIVRLRKELHDGGLDHGATTIRWHLGNDPGLAGLVPSVAGVHRVLVRRGLVTPAPKKRPKSSWKRFEAAAPNERWQIDAMDWATASAVVGVFNIVDDHSRVAARSRAVEETSSEQAWETFTQAAQRWGLPAGMLSDNGLCFSGKLRGFEVLFEAKLRDAGVQPRTGRPYHPQTTGKVERFQQTLKKWLREQPLAADGVELQTQLDEFCEIYNHQRPHQGIGGLTPITRWRATPPAAASQTALAHPAPTRTQRYDATVDAQGVIGAGQALKIHVGVEWGHHQGVVITDGRYATVLIDGQLVRHLKLDPTRRYQPSNRPRGGQRRPRLPQ
jgi:transposase InsO family protein